MSRSNRFVGGGSGASRFAVSARLGAQAAPSAIAAMVVQILIDRSQRQAARHGFAGPGLHANAHSVRLRAKPRKRCACGTASTRSWARFSPEAGHVTRALAIEHLDVERHLDELLRYA